MKANNAKAIYKRMCRMDPLEIRSLKSGGGAKFLIDFSRDINGVMDDIVVSGVNIRAPTPWHAAILCLVLTSLSTSMEEPTSGWKKEEIRDAEVVNNRFIFRGHADSKWKWVMVPKLQRPGVDRGLAKKAVRALARELGAVIPTKGEKGRRLLPPTVFTAVAQHYGIPTNLLDFTLDPTVAVFFACHGRVTKRGQLAAVYFLRSSEARDIGMRILLPPPPAERVYLQRGLFVRGNWSNWSRFTEVARSFRRITFPPDESFRVIRSGRVVDVLPRHVWLDGVVERVVSSADETGTLVLSSHRSSGGLKPRQMVEVDFLTRWLHYLHDVIDWFTMVQSSRRLKFIDVEELEDLVRSNPHLMNWYSVLEMAQHGGVDLRSRKLRKPRVVTSTARVIQETLVRIGVKPLTYELWKGTLRPD